MIAKPLPPTLLVRPKGLYRATQQVWPTHVLQESRPQHLRRDTPWAPTCLESRYQAFIAPRNRITLAYLQIRLLLTVHATTIIIAFGLEHRTDNPTVAIEHFLTYLSVSKIVSWVVSFVISLKFIPWGCLQCSWLVISRKTD